MGREEEMHWESGAPLSLGVGAAHWTQVGMFILFSQNLATLGGSRNMTVVWHQIKSNIL